MNLIIDHGNTNIKTAIFRNDEILMKKIFKSLKIKDIDTIIEEFPSVKKAIISSVAESSADILDYLKNILDICINLDKNTPLPIQNLYESKDSLGYDRIAGVTGAASKFSDSNILVIDSGTAITYNFINSSGQFIGGAISPGAYTRARALNYYTARLPLMELKDSWSFPEKTTRESINSGILSGIVYEIDGHITDLKNNYPDMKTILTGGNIKLFDKKLKNSIFVDLNLNLYGLNRILEYNAK